MNVVRQCALLAAATALVTGSPSLSSASHYDTASERFTFFAWRSLAYHSNDMPVVKLKSYLGSDGTSSVGETGMADFGWHELHPLPGFQTASFADNGDAYPSIAGPVMVGNKPGDWAVFDLPIRWVYDCDILGRTQAFTNVGQTFIATGPALDKVSLHQVSGVEDLSVTVHEGRPGGRQIGASVGFVDGTPSDGVYPGWRIARWLPGDVALSPGKRYYLEIRSKSGKAFSLRAPSKGDVYSGGMAYFDGKPDESSDLGLFISCQRDDMLRSPVLFADRENWVRGVRGVYFRAASANVRVIFTQISFPNTPFHLTVKFKLYKVKRDRTLERVGVDKQCYNYATPGSEHYTGVIYAANEMPLEPKETYFLQVIPVGDGIPEDEAALPRCNLNVRIYGEKVSGMTPVIYDQRIVEATPSHVKLAWKGTDDAETSVLYGLDPLRLDRVARPPQSSQSASIGPLEPGSDVFFRIVKTTRAGGRFETSIYQCRTLKADGQPVTEPPLRPVPQHTFLSQSIGFLHLADVLKAYIPPMPDVRLKREIPLHNGDFRDGLKGWSVGASREISAVSGAGDGSVGWDLRFEKGEDHPAEDVLYQTVNVTPGKTYMLTGVLYTEQVGVTDNWYARLQQGDLLVRLLCDPRGGAEFGGAEFGGNNSSQWFRTDGRWIKFAKVFKAESDRAAVGAGFVRGYNWTAYRALADELRLFEVAGK